MKKIYHNKVYSIIIIIISILNSKEIEIEENEKLLFVWEHFRHGARDPYIKIDPKTWIDFIGVQWKSQGELNSIGLRSHYLLGAATRKRYDNFLSKTFDCNEISIISTDSNRTIMSAMANLQGIYKNFTTPNLTYSQINNSIMRNFNETYQIEINKKIDELKDSYIQNGISIMPIHLFNNYNLIFKLNDAGFCPGIKKYKDEAKNSEEVKKMVDEFYKYTNDTYGKYIFDFMNVSGVERPNYLWEYSDSYTNLYYICDAYIADYISGREMTHIKETKINMEEFYYHALKHSKMDTYYVEYGIPPTKAPYVAVSPMFRSIFNYMERRIYLNEHDSYDSINSSSPKYVIYSGHDSTVGAVDVFLEAEFNITPDDPEYTTSQYFELWRNETGYYIKYLINQREKATYKFEEFKKMINEKTFSKEEVEEICLGKKEEKIKEENIFKKIFFIILSIGIVFLLLLIVLIILEIKKRKLYY